MSMVARHFSYTATLHLVIVASAQAHFLHTTRQSSSSNPPVCEVRVGNNNLDIPVPDGYVLLTDQSVIDAASSGLPPSTRLAAIAIPQELAESPIQGMAFGLEKYFMVQALRTEEFTPLTLDQFAGLQSELKRQYGAMDQDDLRNALDDLPTDSIDISSPAIVVSEGDRHLEIRLLISMAGGTTDIVCYASTCLYGSTLITLCTYAVVRAPSDDSWAELASREWREATLDLADAATPVRVSSEDPMPDTGGAGKLVLGIMGGLFLGAIAIAITLSRRASARVLSTDSH